jgi:hypothetical protein
MTAKTWLSYTDGMAIDETFVAGGTYSDNT